MKSTSHSRRRRNMNNGQHVPQNYTAENVIVFSPTSCRPSEQKEKAAERCLPVANDNKADNDKQNNNNSKPHKKLSENISSFLDKLDSLLTDDIILIIIIGLLIYERNKLKKSGASKSEISDYDYMIAALIYIYI